MAHTGDATYSATKAGYAIPMQAGSELMAKPAIKANVAQTYRDLMMREGLPAAYKTHMALMGDAKTPAGTRASLVSEMYKQTLGSPESNAPTKDLSEMSYDELQRSLGAVKQALAAIEDQAKDVTPEHAPSFMD